MRNNVYKIEVQCTYTDGGKFTESMAVAAQTAESALKKARVEQRRRARVWKGSGLHFEVTDFISVEKVAKDLVV